MNRRQRRELARKKKVKDQNVVHWRGLHKHEKVHEEEPEMQVPGISCPPEFSPEFQTKIEHNIWHDIDQLDLFIQTIKKLSVENDWTWSWSRNNNCKYINLRFDMRDGGFVLTDGERKRIDLPQLEWQYKSVKNETP